MSPVKNIFINILLSLPIVLSTTDYCEHTSEKYFAKNEHQQKMLLPSNFADGFLNYKEINDKNRNRKTSPQTVFTVEYLLKKNENDQRWLFQFQSVGDTITINSKEQIPDTELFRNQIIFQGKKYSLEYGGFRFIYDSDHEILVSYLPDSGLINDNKSKINTDFKITKGKKGADFKFMDSSTNAILVEGQCVKRNTDDYLVLHINTTHHLDLLKLTSVLMFWEMWMKQSEVKDKR
jgi:hypothetical protein